MTGSRTHAANGELLFLAGGGAAALERARPLLAVLGRGVVHLGPTGSGARMKLINNFVCGVQAAALAEAITLIERSGLALDAALSILLSGAPGSPLVNAVAPRMTSRDYTVAFMLALMRKDLTYAMAEGDANGVTLSTAAAARRLFDAALEGGWGQQDFSAVIEAVRRAASPDSRREPPRQPRRSHHMPRSARTILGTLKLPETDAHDLPDSRKRFSDGGQYRIEIPSVEGPRAMEAVLSAADEHEVALHRVSQGSGIMLQTDREIERMVELGRQRGVEVCLFVGPRANWDTGVQAASSGGRVIGSSLRGTDQLVYGIEDVLHANRLGIKSVLVADVGQLMVLGRMKTAGDLPPDFVLKISVTLAAANPATARVLEDLGATSINLPVDLSLAQIAAIRRAVDAAIDFYVESPDDLGGVVRHYEIPELVRVAAPIYLKFGVRNSPGLYPSGYHLEATILALSRERVRRAAIGLGLLRRYTPHAVASPTGVSV